MPLPRPTLVILDMDGTTVRHLNPYVLNALEIADDAIFRTRTYLTCLGKKLGLSTQLRTRRSTRRPRLLVHRTLHKLRRKSVDQIVVPCPGIIDMFELFSAHNIPLGLISNGLGAGYGHDILEKFDLDKFFTATVFREDIHRAKPNPEPILEILKRMKPDLTAADTIWYIGDRAKDVVVALSSRALVPAQIIPIGYGLHAAPMLLQNNFNTDHLVLSYEDWYETVENILKTAPNAIPAKTEAQI